MPTLSKREKTVLELIAEDLSSPEIAERLHLSGRTVEWHSAKVMNKLEPYPGRGDRDPESNHSLPA